MSWQLQRMNGKLTRTQVKTDAGQRILPLLPIARDALLDLALWQSNNRRHAAAHGTRPAMSSPPAPGSPSNRVTSCALSSASSGTPD